MGAKPSRRSQGADAEDRAAELLQQKGFTVITRRFSAPGGEIDIVALDGETLVFVEVKMSRSKDRAPEIGLHDRKWARVRRAAAHYLRSIAEVRAVRYDVVVIDGSGIRHIADAHSPDGDPADIEAEPEFKSD